METTAENNPDLSRAKKISTSRFGEIEIDKNKLIMMTSPLPGFPDDRFFILLPHGPNAPFFWLQSTEKPDLAFIVISPDLVTPQYEPEVSPAVREELQIAKKQNPEFMIILTIPPGKPQEMTANLLGPVAYNAEKRLAKQIILDPKKYDPCWPIPLK
jgi:flagellar assembly factor FliW